jgi:hypothetical protein
MISVHGWIELTELYKTVHIKKNFNPSFVIKLVENFGIFQKTADFSTIILSQKKG